MTYQLVSFIASQPFTKPLLWPHAKLSFRCALQNLTEDNRLSRYFADYCIINTVNSDIYYLYTLFFTNHIVGKYMINSLAFLNESVELTIQGLPQNDGHLSPPTGVTV